MATVVSCPKCERKLKVAPTSIGKSVKCTCGNVFKAQPIEDDAPSAPPPAAETLVVTCGECGTKLKVPAAAQGRKMKCSRCAATFVVGADAMPPATSEAARPPAAPPSMFTDEDEPDDAPRPKKAAAHSELPFEDDETDEDEPKPRSKGKPRPKPVSADEDEPAPPLKQAAAGAGGCVLNVLVALIVLGYIAAFVPMYLGVVPLPWHKPAMIRVNPPPHGVDHKNHNGNQEDATAKPVKDNKSD